MTLLWTNPVMNQVQEAVDCFIDKACREAGYQRGRGMPQPYVEPDLIANIEAEARSEGPPGDAADIHDPAQANYDKLGMPYGGDPAVGNADRLNNAPWMFDDGEGPTLNAPATPYVAPTLTDLIANEEAERRRGNGRAPAPAHGVPAYVPPEMEW
jgi:hypothetical protein